MSKYTPFTDLNNKGKEIYSNIFSTNYPIIMGILNITNDSFYDGGKYINNDNIILQTKKMLEEGANIIDIGAQSSRPGANQISSTIETKKLVPIIKLLKNTFPNIVISVDTFWSNTVKKVVNAGCDIINDISAGQIDSNMFDTIAECNIPYIMMHMKGTPKNMQNNPTYNNVTDDIIEFFQKKIEILKSKNLDKIIIDPGFGFGKTIRDNYQILNELNKLHVFKLPILVGMSRKSMIYNLLNTNPQEALNGTTIVNTIALQNGVKILRVHDVKEAYECVNITNFIKNI